MDAFTSIMKSNFDSRKQHDTNVLPPFQIVSRFGFSRYVAFDMYLDVYYV
jgi:hypothetical protein